MPKGLGGVFSHLSFVICHLSLVICHWSFVIGHLSIQEFLVYTAPLLGEKTNDIELIQTISQGMP
jgi:hypothetical protein